MIGRCPLHMQGFCRGSCLNRGEIGGERHCVRLPPPGMSVRQVRRNYPLTSLNVGVGSSRIGRRGASTTERGGTE